MGRSRLQPTLSLLALGFVLAGCRSVPSAGIGDVAFRLLWHGESDLDLHVEDPAGEHLFYGLREAESGGRLDVDCNAGTGRLCRRPIENVFWSEGTAPRGTYRVWVRAHAVYPREAPVACELLILEGERVRLRVPGRLMANGDRFGPFSLELPTDRAATWRLRPSDTPVPDDAAYRRASGPLPRATPRPEPP